MRVLGIDFGTSNTVAMVRAGDGRTRSLLFDGSPLLPSAVYLGTDSKLLVGRDAERNARMDPSRFEPNPKRRVDESVLLLGDTELALADVFSRVLGHVAQEARRQLGEAPTDVRLTHPARWGERRRNVLVDAARRAGLVQPRLIAEPVGAASYFTAVLGTAVPVGRSIAIYDLGGGTFDATVVRRTQGGFEVLAEEGLPDLGGLDFDHAVVEYIGRTYAGSHPQQWQRLMQPSDQADWRQRRLLYEDIRGAKEMLSRTSAADVHLPALEVDAHITREEFERVVRPYLDQTVACLKRTLASSRLSPQELVGVFLVGGSSRIPLAAQVLHSELGVAPTTLEQPETVVVEGALCIGAAVPPGRPISTPPSPQRPVSTPPARPVSTPPRSVSTPPAGQRPVSTPPMAGRPAVNPQQQQRPPQVPLHRPGQPPQPQRPVSTPQQHLPPPGQQRPISGPLQAQQRPPQVPLHRPQTGPPQVPRAVPQPQPQRPVPTPQPPRLVRPVPQPQRPAGQPAQPQRPPYRPQAGPPRGAPAQQRRWYAEPAVLAMIIVLILIGIAAVVLAAVLP